MNLKRIYSSIIIGFIAFQAFYAQTNTLYYLGAPQSYYLNPASQPVCNIFIGFPGQLYVDVAFEGLNPSNYLIQDPDNQNRWLQPLSPDADLDEFLDDNFRKVNDVFTKLNVTPLNFGFRVKDFYFTADISMKASGGLAYPGSMFDILHGLPNNTSLDLSNFGINTIAYLESALGVSKKFGDQLTVGIRPKLLFGAGVISATNNQINLSTTINEDVMQMVLSSRLEMQIATAGIPIPKDEDGNFDPEGEFDIDSTLSLESVSDYRKLATMNKGLGIDIGAHFEPIPGIKISASIIDLGYINWKNYAHTTTITGEYVFEGVEYSTSDTGSFGSYIADSLLNSFEFEGSDEDIKTSLEPKIFLGGSIELLPRLDVGALARFDMLKTGTQTNVALHATWHPSSVLAISANYSPFGGKAKSFGIGLSSRLGPLHLYLISDYIPTKYNIYEQDGSMIFLLPKNVNQINFQLGLNLVFGCNKRKKLMKDKPMYYSGDY